MAFTVQDTEYLVNTSYTLWEGLDPEGKGLVRIDGEYYLVAMYHQTHVSATSISHYLLVLTASWHSVVFKRAASVYARISQRYLGAGRT